jgi:uncharacterized repeat protein (TIGR03803 family)
MHFNLTSYRIALLGSALALVAFTPAIGANVSHADHRALAAMGVRPAALHQHGSTTARVNPANYTDLYDFTGGADGSSPTAEVTLDGDGNIYGTASSGGAHGAGVIFKLSSDGAETPIYSFDGTHGADPDGAVIVMGNGKIFGTTQGGGSGNGVLYELTPKGSYKVLHAFAGTDDGTFIRGRLVRTKTGDLYGTALFGGVNGDGTVFKYGANGKFSVVHAFNGNDGEFPEHGVVSDSAGNLYGVTAFGGTSGEGTVYKIAADGTFSTLYNFTGGADGGFLYGTVGVGNDGNVYGNTVEGGANSQGTVFRVTQDGTLTTLYNFTGGADGGAPEGDMLVAGKKLYSMATSGGDPSCQCGGVYKVNAKGKETMLYAFTGADGAGYSAGLTQGGKTLYGTASGGGANGDGVVFSVTKK